MIQKKGNQIADERRDHLDEHIGFDYILREAHTSDFSEFVIDIGGDVLTYRVYGNKSAGFTITAR